MPLRTATPKLVLNPMLAAALGYTHPPRERVPDPIDFIVSPNYLDRPNLYPRQATFIKVVFLCYDLFTDYDFEVIAEWEESFKQTGYEGCSPQLLDRLHTNATCPCGHYKWFHANHQGQCEDCDCTDYRGRPWFREVLSVIGRRGSKNYIGALCLAYILWTFMHLPDGPQEYFGIDRDKTLQAIVFAGKKEQAQANQWRDMNDVVLGAPCFQPYIAKPLGESLTIRAPVDDLRYKKLLDAGINPASPPATFTIVPSASVLMAGRGPASWFEAFDEMAHIVASGSNRDAESIFTSATPSLDQFGVYGFIYEPSSPWQKIGQFYTNWQQAIEMENGKPVYPEKMMVQLPSWGLYLDWERADTLPMRKGRPETFRKIKRPIQVYDDDMRKLERANPETFAVERRSRWAETINAYLNTTKVEAAFDNDLTVKYQGALGTAYIAHGDPANTNCRFGWALGHRVWDEERKLYRVVFDQIRCWEPGDFEDFLIDYDVVMGDIEQDVFNFVPEEVSFDQFNVPSTVGRLRKSVSRKRLPRNVRVYEKTANRSLNWQRFEFFKAALNMDLIDIPLNKPDGEVNYASEQLELELRFLEDKGGEVRPPTSGPVQTKDIADCVVQVTYALLGEQMASVLGQLLMEAGVSGSTSTYSGPPRSDDNNEVVKRLAAVNTRYRKAQQPASPSRGMRKR